MNFKLKHEFRDPIHGFIKVLSDERRIVDSPPLQRLRDVNQLGLTYLLYPSATHKRFEHSLGVMELASKVFDVITALDNYKSEIAELIPEIKDEDKKKYWRRIVRIAALCHDIGHLPFSHVGEKDLLPEDWNHERMSVEIIEGKLKEPFGGITPPVRVEDVIKVAIGPRRLTGIKPELQFSLWETILAEIIVGDVFGVDRMDYLLRDSHHIGVAYGKFDHFRLIDTLRILPDPQSHEPKLGVEIGGLHAAESLLLARYFMFSQVYLHHIRRIYDVHLREFLKSWLKKRRNEPLFSTDTEEFLTYSDSLILEGLVNAFKNQSSNEYHYAKRIFERNHFRLLYERNPSDVKTNLEAVNVIYGALCEKFGTENFIIDESRERGGLPDFPVIDRNGEILPSQAISDVLSKLPLAIVGFIFVNPGYEEEARKWIHDNKASVLQKAKEEVKNE